MSNEIEKKGQRVTVSVTIPFDCFANVVIVAATDVVLASGVVFASDVIFEVVVVVLCGFL